MNENLRRHATSASRLTVALIVVALVSFAIGAGSILVTGVEKAVPPPIPSAPHEPPGVPRIVPGATPGPILGPEVPIGQLTQPKTEEPPLAPLPKPAQPVAPPPKPPAVKPTADNPPSYYVPCRRDLFRRR